MFDHVITTAETKKITDGGIILTADEKGAILTRQTVLVAGPNANVVPGEEIEINVDRFPRKNIGPARLDIGEDRYIIVPPIEIINEKPYLFISSREIKYVYEQPEINTTSTDEIS
jgi:hypothetical protein